MGYLANLVIKQKFLSLSGFDQQKPSLDRKIARLQEQADLFQRLEVILNFKLFIVHEKILKFCKKFYKSQGLATELTGPAAGSFHNYGRNNFIKEYSIQTKIKPVQII